MRSGEKLQADRPAREVLHNLLTGSINTDVWSSTKCNGNPCRSFPKENIYNSMVVACQDHNLYAYSCSTLFDFCNDRPLIDLDWGNNVKHYEYASRKVWAVIDALTLFKLKEAQRRVEVAAKASACKPFDEMAYMANPDQDPITGLFMSRPRQPFETWGTPSIEELKQSHSCADIGMHTDDVFMYTEDEMKFEL